MEQILKVFGAAFWHGSVNIVGSKDALIELRDAIDEAIQNDTGSAYFYEVDGEGYEVTVNCEDRSIEEWAKLPTHYTDEVATNSTEEREKALHELVS